MDSFASTLRALAAGPVLALAISVAVAGLSGATPASATDAPNQTIAQLGTLSFPTSTRSAPAQTAFVEGMLLLHLFEYERAEAAFRRAEQLDPDFAMAYWGEAMTATHPVWNQQNVAKARAALARLGATPQARADKAPSAREKAWLATVEILYGDGSKAERDQRLLAAMETFAADYPDDDEVQLFLSLALLGVTQGERNVPNFLRAAEIAKGVYRHNPQHPGAAHYWIHGMDDPEHAAGALEAAHALSKIAPGAGHGQHMTAHIFMALGMWDAVIESNVAAVKVVEDGMRAKGQPAYSCGHYAEWLQYGYYQQGRQREAWQVLDACRREGMAALAWLRSHPDTSPVSPRKPEPMKQRLDGTLVNMRGVSLVEAPAYRKRALAMDIDVSDIGRDRGWALFSRGLAQAEQGETRRAARSLADLRALASQPPEKNESAATAGYLVLMANMLEGALAEKSGNSDKAIALVEAAAKAYDAIPFDFGPPVPIKPPHELLGEIQLRAKRPAFALAQFDLALKAAPNRALSMLGRARALDALGEANSFGSARQAYAELLTLWRHADPDVPALAEVRAKAR